MHLQRLILAAALACVGASPGDSDGWQSLYDGKGGLDGWVAEGQTVRPEGGKTLPIWTADGDRIVCDGKGFGFLRYDRREFADFAWHVEFKLAPKCNTGLGIRTRDFNPILSMATRPSKYSYEIQLIDDVGKTASVHSSGSLYRYVAPSANALKPAGEWNAIDVECVGPRIKVTLNGVGVIDVDQSTVDDLKSKPLKGYVCLQNHGGRVEFRAIRVKDLAPTPAAP